MKNSHVPQMLLSIVLAAGWAAAKPARSGGVAQDASKNGERRESAPALIVVIVDAERSVFLGKERVGTCDDVGPLKEGVRKAIERNRRAARDHGDEEPAKGGGTVFICATSDLKYRDVVKVIDAIKEAGGDPVGLQTDCQPQK